MEPSDFYLTKPNRINNTGDTNMKKIKILCMSFILLYFAANLSAGQQFTNTVVSLTGRVYDYVSRQPLSMNILVLDYQGKKVQTTKSNAADNGNYYITGLKPGETYFLTFTNPGYFKEKFQIEIPNTDKYIEVSRDFLIKPLEIGAKLKIPVPPFELNKTKLRFGSKDILESMKNSLENNPSVHFQILVYPDNNTNAEANLKLTEERCKSLMNYFVLNGIPESFMTFKANGETDPTNPPPTTLRSKGKRYIGTSYLVVTEK